MDKYVTMQGDMWDGIAYKAYGSTAFTDRLIAANPQYIEYYLFPAGVVLSLPDVDIFDSAEDDPPWKQVNG